MGIKIEEENIVLWLSDDSTYEVVDLDASATVQYLTDEGLEAIEDEGEELKGWSSNEIKKYVKREISLAELIRFWELGHS